MTLPSKDEARTLLHEHVQDDYQRFHAEMVAAAMEGYAKKFKSDTTWGFNPQVNSEQLWWLTGYFHDIDYDEYPDKHPGPSLEWFRKWEYPEELIHAVEAHANGFNGFTTKPETTLAKALIACDEICGIFYAYQKLNPIPFGEMKVKSIKKRLKEERFAPGIDRAHIYDGVEDFGVSLGEHIEQLIRSFEDFAS